MFNKLMNFGHERTAPEAVGFYIAYFAIFLIIAGIIGGLSTLTGGTNEEIIERASRFGIVAVTILTLSLAFSVIIKKQLINDFSALALGILAGFCAMLGGALLGLLPVAFLTTWKINAKELLKEKNPSQPLQ